MTSAVGARRMASQLRAWSGPAVIVAGCLTVWAGLDCPRFVRGYLHVLDAGGRLALLALGGVAIWSLANRGGRR